MSLVVFVLLFHGTAYPKDFQIGFFHIDYLGDGYTDLKPRSEYAIVRPHS